MTRAELERLVRDLPDEALTSRLAERHRTEVWLLVVPVPGFAGVERVSELAARDLRVYHGNSVLEAAVHDQVQAVRDEARRRGLRGPGL